MKKKNQRKNKPLRIIVYIVVGLVYLLSYTIYCACDWAKDVFNVGIEEIIFTLSNPLKGTGTEIVNNFVKSCIPKIVFFVVLYIAIVIVDWHTKASIILYAKIKKFRIKINFTKIARVISACFCMVALTASFFFVDEHYQLFAFIENRMQATTIYEDYYVNPKTADIRFAGNGQKKNLLYIYLESMETTYSSTENGGKQKTDYMPLLGSLARENVSFSNTDKLGGFYNTYGTGWTMASLLATTSGIPFAFPVDSNAMNERETFAKGLTNLGDILHSFGYKQEFLCGSNAEFAGRKTYFRSHGNYEIFDLFTAREQGFIAEDYHNGFWGYEDKYLYEIAKSELLELSANAEPFNLTILTVDTHHFEGYTCSLCKDEYEVTTANVVSCADRQAYEFIEWCKQQEFYENTVIVITGDHPRMDTYLVEEVEEEEPRPIYNCFLNAKTQETTAEKNRVFTPMDIFPSVLSAMGFTWNGNRLGLGTDMFSGKQTLAEELGFECLNDELSKTSNYYNRFN